MKNLFVTLMLIASTSAWSCESELLDQDFRKLASKEGATYAKAMQELSGSQLKPLTCG
jgi:hypothetical protein